MEPEGQNIPTERKVADSLYGFISFPLEIWDFIDTPHFQRLRYIKQLGTLSWVFPGGGHSRFEHCLGTGHLAQKYIRTLIDNHQKKPKLNPEVTKQYSSDKIRYQAQFTVTLAGVLHDIGHGPYSHLFDSVVKYDKEQNPQGIQGWEHEIAGLKLIDLLYEYVLKNKNEQDRETLLKTKDRVKALIIGKKLKEEENTLINFNQTFQQQLKSRSWQFEIVSNSLTGIDVDKLDYFRRDAFYIGAKNIYIEHDLLMKQSLILKDSAQKNRICYPSKYSSHVNDIFYSRYKLYKTYYFNFKLNGNDLLVKDILKKANKKLGIIEKCKKLLDEPECSMKTDYIYLNDSLLHIIQYDQSQELNEARELLERLETRDIYDFICEYHQYYSLQDKEKYQFSKKSLIKKKKEIQAIGKGELSQKSSSKFRLDIRELGFGMKDKSPFQQCRFFDKSQKEIKVFGGEKNLLSMLQSQGNIELSVRLYATDRKISIQQREKAENILKADIKMQSGERGTSLNRKLQRMGQQEQREAKQLNKQIEGQMEGF